MKKSLTHPPYFYQSENLAKYKFKRKHQFNLTILNDFLFISNKFLVLQLFKQWLSIVKIGLVVMITTKHLFVTQIFGLKLEEKCFFVIQISVTKIIGKTVIWTNFRFWVSPPNYTNLGFMFLTQQSHVQLRVLWNLHSNANNFVLLEKKPGK